MMLKNFLKISILNNKEQFTRREKDKAQLR